jgi:spore maturation protein CgeB
VKAVEILSRMDGVRFEGGIYAAPDDRKYKLVHGTFRRLWTKLADDGPASESDRNRHKSPADYYREIARSKIAVSIRGGGWTPSPRYYEIVAMNTLLISDTPEAEIPNNFVHRQHAVFCRPDLRDLESLVRHYLREEKEREIIAREGHAHLLKYHTCERRAEYFLDACRRLL